MSDSKHPQYSKDRALLTSIIKDGTPIDLNLVEVARLRIRYDGFPGARDIQQDLERMLETWDLTEEQLFEKTRELHATGDAYKESFSNRDDWA
ncbi:MAG: DUF3288 family protein [Cyanobacteria bacterium J06597_1]